MRRHPHERGRGWRARAGAVTLSAACVLAGLGTPAIGSPAVAAPSPQAVGQVPVTDPNLQLQGRWGRTADAATTVNSGSRARLRFAGTHIAGLFDVSTIANPPQIYVSIDGSAPTLHNVDRPRITFTPLPLTGVDHVLELVVKDVDERANRWVPPLRSGLILTGFELEPGRGTLPLPPVTGPRMMFLGDSITQGVRAVGPQIGPNGSDATRDYAWLVGKAFRADIQQVGFGAQGITRGGGGNVPRAADALPLNFQGSAADPSFIPDAIVVNQGTNDGGASSAQFEPAYAAYLRQIRSRWPAAWIFAMRPLNGAHAQDIAAAVTGTNDLRVVYVDTADWVQRDEYTDGLHPSYSGHLAAAHRLARVIADKTDWAVDPVKLAKTRLFPKRDGVAGFEDGTVQGWQPGALVTGVTASTATPPRLAAPYEGGYALLADSAVAPLGEWRSVDLTLERPLPLPRARDVFVYIRVPTGIASAYSLRLSVTAGSEVRSVTETNVIPFFWNRLHVNLPDDHMRISTVSVSVRAEGAAASTSGTLTFQLDDLGWTSEVDG